MSTKPHRKAARTASTTWLRGCSQNSKLWLRPMPMPLDCRVICSVQIELFTILGPYSRH